MKRTEPLKSKMPAAAFLMTLTILAAVCLSTGLIPAALAAGEEANFDWYGYGYDLGEYDSIYGQDYNPDRYDNNGSDEYLNGYEDGYFLSGIADWFRAGQLHGQSDKANGQPYQPLAWENDGSPNYYAGYDNGYYGAKINWYNVGWYNGFNDAQGLVQYRPEAYYSNKSEEYYNGYYTGYYGSFTVTSPDAVPPEPDTAQPTTEPVATEAPWESVFQIGSQVYTRDGQSVQMDVSPYSANNRVFVPLRYLAQACGLTNDDIHWDPATGKAVLQQPGGVSLVFTLGQNQYQVNAESFHMDTVPELRDGRVFLPARYAAESLGYQAEWDEESRTVRISR